MLIFFIQVSVANVENAHHSTRQCNAHHLATFITTSPNLIWFSQRERHDTLHSIKASFNCFFCNKGEIRSAIIYFFRLLAQTTLRNILGTKNLHEILSDRESISSSMQVPMSFYIYEYDFGEEREKTIEERMMMIIVMVIVMMLLMKRHCRKCWTRRPNHGGSKLSE